MPAIGPVNRQLFLRYILPLLTTALAVLVTNAVQPFVAPIVTPPFILAVAIAALYGGRGPGLITSALSVGALSYWFFPNADADPGTLGRPLMFLTAALATSVIAGTAYEQRRRAVGEVRENERLRRLAEEAATEAGSATRVATDALSRAEAEARRSRDAETALREAHEATS